MRVIHFRIRSQVEVCSMKEQAATFLCCIHSMRLCTRTKSRLVLRVGAVFAINRLRVQFQSQPVSFQNQIKSNLFAISSAHNVA